MYQQRGWVVACIVAVLGLASTASADDSWVGKRVMTKKDGLTIGHTNKKGQEVVDATLDKMEYTVEEEKGEWIKVHAHGVSGWFAKRDAVLLENAVDYFTDRIRDNSNDDSAYGHRAWAWKQRGELDIALKDYEEAIRLDPKAAAWFIDRGIVWSTKKEYGKAIVDFDEGIRLDPKIAPVFTLRGNAWKAKKEYAKSIADYDEAIRLDPKYDWAIILRAWLLATCPNEKDRDGKKAVESAIKACELIDYKEGLYFAVLAAAYAEAGDFSAAVEWQTKALKDADYEKKAGDDGRKALNLYEDHKPYRIEK